MFKATAAALLALALIGPAGVSAGTPGWKFYITPIPADGIVAPGTSAGFVVTIANEGRSNISALFLDTDPNALPPSPVSPTYVGPITYTNQPGGVGSCHDAGAGPLYCDFGSLVAGASVTVTVAFQMPASGSTFFNFRALGNGNTPSDGGTSHGDALKALISINGGNSHPPATPAASITLNGSKNFAGGFSPDTTTVQNDQSLGSKNIQSGQVVPPAGGIAVTLEDGLPDSTFNCTSLGVVCSNRFGEWARLNVANGAQFTETGIHVSIIVLGSKVPGAATVATIDLIHVPTNPDGSLGTPYVISNRCDNPDGGLDGTAPHVLADECILVTQVGKNFRIDGWLLNNGGARGAY